MVAGSRWISPTLSRTSLAGVRCTKTSCSERSRSLGSRPSENVRQAWGSRSTRRTRRPCSASAAPRAWTVVVFATPPFWLATAKVTGIWAASVGRSAWPERWPVEVVDGREFLDRATGQTVGLVDRAAEGQHPGQGEVVRRPEQVFHLGLPADGHGRQHAAEPLGPGGQKNAPRERIDRGAARHRVAVEVPVDGGQRPQVGEQHEEDGNLVEVFGE